MVQGNKHMEYENRVIQEQDYCLEHDVKRLRLAGAHPHEVGGGGQTYMLAITQANDLDLVHDDAKHNEHPMLVDRGPSSKLQYYAPYTQKEYDAITAGADKDGVFLARTKDTDVLGHERREVIPSTVQRSMIPYNHDKHVSHTKLAQQAAVAKKAEIFEVDEAEDEMSF